MEAGTLTGRGGSFALKGSPRDRLPDQVLRWTLTAVSGLVVVLIAFFFYKLIDQSSPVISRYGLLDFIFGNDWNPAANSGAGIFKALPLVVGTLVTSAIALIIGVPIAIATALYVTELAPRRVRGPLTIMVELLAAVPSVVYGLWGYLFLAPKLEGFQQFLADKLGFLPWVGGTVGQGSYFIGGLVLAIMILPIVSAIAREVMSTVPPDLKEASLALGATRWEMIRQAVLPYSRSGIVGGAMLGLGRAIGETIAVAYVIGGSLTTGNQVFAQGTSLAAQIASEFGEAASDPFHRSALLGAGLVLFILTLVVNVAARFVVARSAVKAAAV